MPRHQSLNLGSDAFLPRQDRLNLPPLLLRREVNNWPESPFRYDGRGQGIAKGGDGLQHFRGEVEKPQHLGHTGTGDPQLAGQVRRMGAIPI